MKDEKTNPETQTLGQRAKALRELYGLSQAQFGKEYDIPLRTIQNWEGGINSPPKYVINMMEKIYNLTERSKEGL